VRPDQVSVTGTPQFDCHFRSEFQWTRDEFCRRVGADPSRPIVLYTTGMANHMPGEPRIVEGIAAMLREMSDLGRPQLMVRVYPKDLTGRFEPVKQSCPDVLFPALNCVGAAFGKPIAPQTASVGVSTTTQVRREGNIIRYNLAWTLAMLGYVVLVAVLFAVFLPHVAGP